MGDDMYVYVRVYIYSQGVPMYVCNLSCYVKDVCVYLSIQVRVIVHMHTQVYGAMEGWVDGYNYGFALRRKRTNKLNTKKNTKKIRKRT